MKLQMMRLLALLRKVLSNLKTLNQTVIYGKIKRLLSMLVMADVMWVRLAHPNLMKKISLI